VLGTFSGISGLTCVQKFVAQNSCEMTVLSILCKVCGSHTSSAEDLTLLACGTVFGLGVAKDLKDCNALEMSVTAHLKVLSHVIEDLNPQPSVSIKGSILSELQNYCHLLRCCVDFVRFITSPLKS